MSALCVCAWRGVWGECVASSSVNGKSKEESIASGQEGGMRGGSGGC